MIELTDSVAALRLIEILMGASLLLASLEYVIVLDEFRPGGLAYGGATFRGGGGLRRVYRSVSSAPVFPLLAAVRGLGAIALMVGVSDGPWGLPLLVGVCVATIMINMTFVFGTDASDQIAMLVLFGLTFGAPFRDSEVGRTAVLWFIASISTISYMSAGLSKVRIREWRDGRFVRNVAACELYGHPFMRWMLGRRSIAVLSSWIVMGFETLFFLVLVGGPVVAPTLLVVAFLFHASNAVFMGLNRFVMAFLATYPALWFCGQQQQTLGELARVIGIGG